MSSSEADKYKAMEKSLREPFGLEYQENVLKTRRNLLVVGRLCILVWLAGLKITPQGNFSFFGIPFQGIDSHLMFLRGLLATIFYLTIHFGWNSFDAIQEYRLRQSGAKVRYQTGGMWGIDGVDAPVHPTLSRSLWPEK